MLKTITLKEQLSKFINKITPHQKENIRNELLNNNIKQVTIEDNILHVVYTYNLLGNIVDITL